MNARKLLTIGTLLACLLFMPGSPGYTEFFFDESQQSARQMDIVAGETKVIPVSNPKRVAIGDPKVADIAEASKTEILLSAKADGATNLQIWDDYGQREIALRVFKEDLGALKTRLEDLFATAGVRGITFQIGDKERKIFVLGDLPMRKKDVVAQLLENFKDKVINLLTFTEDNPVVEIDVQVMEISKTAEQQLGIDWTPTALKMAELTPAPHTMSRNIGDAIKAIGQSRFQRDALTAVINILETDKLARTLARPKMVALSGKEAKILVGGQVPILSSVSVSQGTTTTSVEYVDYGIQLSIKPVVKETGDIICRLDVQTKDVDKSNTLTVAGTTTPAFKTRSAQTELFLKNNQTVFLGGLINNATANDLSQVPGFGDIPILGALFRSKHFTNGDTELILSITPHIVNYGDMRKDIEDAVAGKKGEGEEPADAYSHSVQDTILKNISYPMEAQRANLTGTVVVSLHLLANGQLVNAVVNQSSGHKMLDQAAIFTAKRLAPYPVFPKGLILKEIWIDVPITYQLT